MAKKKIPKKTKKKTAPRKKTHKTRVAKKKRSPSTRATAETMAQKQREISVSEFFLKNRHLLGFDNPRKALLTTVKEAVDNALDACEEARILPEIDIEIRQLEAKRFIVHVTDNGPGVVPQQIPKIFAKLLYGSKFHRLRMSRGQQGIGISAAGMYGQLTTGKPTAILSRTQRRRYGHMIEVQIDTRKNQPAILKNEEIKWSPEFHPVRPDGKPGKVYTCRHGTRVSIQMEAAYVRGRVSVDEYLKQCAIVNPHLQLNYRVYLDRQGAEDEGKPKRKKAEPKPDVWITYDRVTKKVPVQPREIKPHPHGIELGILMQMLKDTKARTLRNALIQDFSRVSNQAALNICKEAGLNPKASPTRIANRESEALYKAISETKLMRPPTDCLAPIGEKQLSAGLKKEVKADFYAAAMRPPSVYRGNPFQIEVCLAYAAPGKNEQLGADRPATVMRFANRVPLLYMSGACAITKAITAVNWKNYGLSQPRGSLPIGPLAVTIHMASVWVPFTSESKEAVAHYPEIIGEITLALQECGRQLAVHLRRRHREAEAARKREHMQLYIPHLALGLRQILGLAERQEKTIIRNLNKMLEKTRLEK